ncbi:MAG TPA: SIMPL domain-containing protein [Ignavibacteria bacterium]|nr:SIMPL domain-containing protein [Ignavibacteria bacterium]
MKKILFLILSFLVCSTLYSQDKQKVVEVTGSATIEVQPDIMNWDIRVQDDYDNLKSAVNNNESSVERILEFLKSQGVKREKISTSGLRVNKNYTYYDSKVKKYTVTNYIWFSVNDINLYQKFADYFVSFDNVYINSTNLSASNEIETRKQARINALIAAKEKAEMMAAVFGKEIGDPLMISEEPVYSYFSNTMNNVYTPGERTEGDSGPTFSRGMVTVTAKVKVTFLLK